LSAEIDPVSANNISCIPVRAVLTPVQQAKFDEMLQRHEDTMDEKSVRTQK